MEKRTFPLFDRATKLFDSSDTSKLCTMAEDILESVIGKAAHIDEIVGLAIQRGVAPSNLSEGDLKRKLNAAISSNAKRKSGAIFAKVSYRKAGKLISRKGWYKLKSRIVGPIVSSPDQAPTNLFMGKFGEYAVISELLYWGINVSPMIVDRGIDLVAEKNNKYFYLQVKSSLEADQTWRFSIKRSSFDANHSNLMYYIFVLRAEKEIKNTYVILPSTYIDTLVKGNSIKGDTSALSIKISTQDKGKTWRLNNTECSMFVNAFGQLV